MYKTVEFNIRENDLKEIIYRKFQWEELPVVRRENSRQSSEPADSPIPKPVASFWTESDAFRKAE